MKKNISIIASVLAVLCIDQHSASASLLGMPMSLKAAVELRQASAAVPVCQFYTGDMLTGSLLQELLTSNSQGD